MTILGISLPDPIGWITGAVDDVVLAPVNALANAIATAVQTMLTALGTAWVKIDTPQLASENGHASATVGFLQAELRWIVLWAAVAALIVAGARMAWEGRADPARDALRGLITLTVVSGCGVAVIGLAVSASDQLAESIIDASTHGNGMGKSLVDLLALSGGTMAPFLVILLGLLALLVSLVQIGLMVFRAAALVLLASCLPLAASFTSTQMGRDHFRRYVAWVAALVMYKPAAALAYGAAFKLLSSRQFNTNGLLSVLVGLALMTMAVVALPALLKFMVPAVGALAHGGVGAGVAGSAAAMAIPIGAKAVASGGGGAGAAAMGGARGASGPSGASSAPSGGSPGPSGGNGGPGSNGSSGSSGGPGAAGLAGVAGAAQNGAGAAAPAMASAGPAGAAVAAAGAAVQGAKTATNHAAAPTNAKDGPDGSQH